jgi:hypothetical protein
VTDFTAGSLLAESMPAVRTRVIACFEVECYRGTERVPPPQNPGVHFQLMLDKEKVSPGGGFIYFGLRNEDGDQLSGWQRMDWIRVVEVLGVEGE